MDPLLVMLIRSKHLAIPQTVMVRHHPETFTYRASQIVMWPRDGCISNMEARSEGSKLEAAAATYLGFRHCERTFPPEFRVNLTAEPSIDDPKLGLNKAILSFLVQNVRERNVLSGPTCPGTTDFRDLSAWNIWRISPGST
jgi:hypothetical protein